MIRRIDRALLAELSAEAQAAPRLRKNRNFHPRDDHPGHRLLNAIEPGSYVVPHRHLNPDKDETMLCLAGRLGVVIFALDGQVQETLELRPAGDACGVDIPHGVVHTVLALERGTVMFEAKAGPYCPLSADEVMPWAPAEGSEAARQCWNDWRRLFA